MNNLDEKKAPQKLELPMIFYNKDGSELISPMDFFDAEPDEVYIPPKEEISFAECPEDNPEYETPMIDKAEEKHADNSVIFKVPSILIKEPPSCNINGLTLPFIHTSKKDGLTTYEVMQFFLSQIGVIVVKERFYIYNGHSYVPSSNTEVARKIVEVCRSMVYSRPSGFIDGVTNYILKEPNAFVLEQNLPKNLVAFQNGILNIDDFQLYKHSRIFLTVYEVLANYSPQSHIDTPFFDKFIYDISGGDATLSERIMQVVGYCLTPDTRGKCLFLFQGVGNSGKSVLTNLIQKLVSDNAVMQLDLSSFNDKFAMSNLVGKAVCSCPDLPSAPLEDKVVSKLKQLTGNDPVSSDVKYGNHVKFVCSAKIILTTNHALRMKTRDDAFLYRICTVPFRYSIQRENQNFDILDYLWSERDGIVTKALLAYSRLKSNGYCFEGNYRVNEVVSNDITSDGSLDGSIYEFLIRNFIADKTKVIPTELIHKKYCEFYGFIPINTFSERFGKMATDVFHAEKTRSRLEAGSNPVSCFKGISFVEGIG